MTQTTFLGTIGKWAGLGAGLLALLAAHVPPGNTTTYLASGSGLLAALAHVANGEGNRQSVTGTTRD